MLGIFHLADAFKEVAERPIAPGAGACGARPSPPCSSRRPRAPGSRSKRPQNASPPTSCPSAPRSSSLEKGESLRDTIETIDAMGVDAMVVRHKSSGVPSQVRAWTKRQRRQRRRRPARAPDPGPPRLLHDPRSAPRARSRPVTPAPEDLRGLRIGIIGDIRHSRVARSDVLAMTTLGAEVVLVGPRTLLPPSLDGWPVKATADSTGCSTRSTSSTCCASRRSAPRPPSCRRWTSTTGVSG